MGGIVKRRLIADAKCYLCGHVCGTVQGEHPSQPRWSIFRPADRSESVRLRDWRQLRCQICGGPTYLDEVQVVREITEGADLWSDARKRSRRTRGGKAEPRARKREP